MKKVILSTIFATGLALASQAQLKLGITAGAGVSNQHSNSGNSTKLLSSDAFKNYHAGFIADIQLASHLYLQPQLLYAKTGARYKTAESTGKFVSHNIELPVNILYKANLPFGKLVAGAGPWISYGLSGKMEQDAVSKKLYTGDMKDWKRFNAGASALLGVELNNGLFANINYSMGITDMNAAASAKVTNRSVALSVGYLVNWH